MMSGYRSKIHSPLEASPNKYRTDVLSPLEASPTKYRSCEASLLEATWSSDFIGWYKVNEGLGSILYNSAPSSIHKFPDLDIVIPGSNFWTTYSGFGYWDGVSTVVNKSFTSTNPLTGAITVIFFGRDEFSPVGAQKTGYQLMLRPGPSAYIEEWVRPPGIGDNTTTLSGIASADETYIILSPCATYVNRNFVKVYRDNPLNGSSTMFQQIKFATPPTGWFTSSAASAGKANGQITQICLGYNGIAAPVSWWKGILGDIMIWNRYLTDTEVFGVVNNTGSRWNIV